MTISDTATNPEGEDTMKAQMRPGQALAYGVAAFLLLVILFASIKFLAS